MSAGVGGRHPFGRSRRDGRSFLIGCIFLATALAGCAHVQRDDALAARVDALMAPLVDSHEFSGAVVLARQGRVVYQRGFGMANRTSGHPFTPRTPGDGGSLAKTFTAAGVWWLAHEGRIDLDAPVTRYVAEYPHAETTVRHLVSHSNGLPWDYGWFDPHFRKEELRTTQAMLKVLALHAPTPAFPPGSQFEYSSLGFDVAGLLIERVTGQRYEEFLSQRFFSRLGMRDSFLRPGRLSDWIGVRTLGYRWRDSSWVRFDVFDMEAFWGGSNIYFSAMDLSRWASAHSSGTALPAAVFEAGLLPAKLGGVESGLSGLNWYCDEARTRCYYSGDLNAFYSFVYWDRARDESVVYASNSTIPPWRRGWLVRELKDALAGQPGQVSPPVRFVPLDPKDLAAVVGVYENKDFGSITLRKGAQGLRARVADGLEYDLFPVGDGVLYLPGMDLWLRFSGGMPPSTLHVRSALADTVYHRSQH